MLNISAFSGTNIQLRRKDRSNIAATTERAPGVYHVLVVHHLTSTLHMMETMFSKFGFQVSTACNSAKALIHFDRAPCDLLFADLEAPVVDGYQLAGQIKQCSPQTKVVLMTCRCQAELVDFMKDDTVDGWLFKPFKTNALINTLDNIGLYVKWGRHTCFC